METTSNTKTQKLTPKDFVLYAAMMLALVCSVSAFLVLVFQYIEYLYPDPLQWADPYNGSMRFAIATLFVLFPMYIALAHLTNKDVRAHPEKKELGFRKWLMYVALLVAGAILVGDLIALINNFLGGDLTTQFMLKALSIFVVIGGAFTYYLLLLRGYWDTREHASRIYGGSVATLVFATVVAGFFIMGSPAEQRLLRFDEQKVAHLGEIQSQTVWYWQTTRTLPEDLTQIENDLLFRAPKDPQSGAAYEYERRGDLTFALCAEFNRESRASTVRRGTYFVQPVGIEETWEHPAGRHCFERTIDPARYPEKVDGGVPMMMR